MFSRAAINGHGPVAHEQLTASCFVGSAKVVVVCSATRGRCLVGMQGRAVGI